MKYTLLFAFCFCFLGLSNAQTQTLFNDNNSYGGFGGPIVEFSNINGSLVGDVGGGGGLVVNNFFVGGYGLGNDGSSVTYQEQNYDIDFGHGGFWLGYAFTQHKLVHLYSSFRIGWGEVELNQNDDKKFSDNLFAVAPELGLEINVTNWFKLGFTGGYRLVSGLDDLPALTNDDFTGIFGGLTFRFGGFGDYESYSSNSYDDDDDDFDF